MKFKHNAFSGNLFKVVFSRGLSMLTSIMIGFIIPKILGVTGYGYLKIFTLYTVYTAFLHFGFSDGILLKFAGKDFNLLDKMQMRTYTVFFILLEIIVSSAMLAVCMLLVPDKYRFIALMLSINMIAVNITGYYQFISQATKRFSEYSIRNIIASLLKLILVFSLLAVYKTCNEYISYKIYLTALNAIEIILLMWYTFTYRTITFGKRNPISSMRRAIAMLFKNGIILTVAYQVGHLAFALDRQFVSVLYDTNTYSVYAFAYNIISVFTTLITSVEVVIFPMLKSIKKEQVMTYFETAQLTVALVSCLCIAGYFPITIIVKYFLSEYMVSISYLRIIIPALTVTCCLSVVSFTYYKVLDKNIVYLIFGAVTIAIGASLNYLANIIFHDPAYISWASVITVIIWFLMTNIYFSKNYGTRWFKIFIFMIMQMASFYIISFTVAKWYIAMMLFVTVFIVCVLLFYRKEMLFIMKKRLCV